jgi:hypothetical protein
MRHLSRAAADEYPARDAADVTQLRAYEQETMAGAID